MTAQIAVVRFLWRRHRFLLVLVVVWGAAVAWLFSWMASLSDLREGITKLIKVLPPLWQRKISPDVMVLLDPTGAMTMAFEHPMMMAPFLLWAMLLPLRHIATEQERGLLDIILARRIARSEWLAGIAFWSVAGLLTIAAVVSAAFIASASYFPQLANVKSGSLVQIAFMQAAWSFAVSGVAAALAARTGRFRFSLGATVAFVLFMMFGEVICRYLAGAKRFAVFSLWYWTDPINLYLGKVKPASAVAVLLLTAIAAWTVAFVWFSKRDLAAR